MGKLSKHLKVIRVHRRFVRKACFKLGIPWRGLVHDLSKYSFKELGIYKYYNGKRSPHQEARDQIGYSPSWINHFHKNKHHWEYWVETDEDANWVAIKIPYKYVIEMLADFIGAGKAYNSNQKKEWTTRVPIDYWFTKCEGKRLMHQASLDLFKGLLRKFADFEDERDFYRWYKGHKKEIKAKYEHKEVKY